jgi:site-specific DNA-cytosine methylase
VTHTTLTVGRARGRPRVYLEGKWLVKCGFVGGEGIDVQVESDRVVITVGGSRRVTPRSGGRSVIDLNVTGVFEAGQRVDVRADSGKIVVTVARTAMQRAQRAAFAGLLTALSYFSGGGLLDQAAACAGYKTTASVEIDPVYAQVHADNHGMCEHFVQSVEEVDHAEIARRGPFELMLAGIPCQPFSTLRRSGPVTVHPEEHALGDMTFWTLHAIALHNPHSVLIEQVPAYLASASFRVLTAVLRRLGYLVEARTINPLDHGAITGRTRAVIVGTTFSAVNWPDPAPRARLLGEVLEDVPRDSPLWFEADHWAVRHWKTQKEKGAGFAPPILSADSPACPTLRRRYFNGQGDQPVVAHPERAETYRWLTLTEVRRIMGVPDSYALDVPKTRAGEILGQGVEVGSFTRIIKSIMLRA